MAPQGYYLTGREPVELEVLAGARTMFLKGGGGLGLVVSQKISLNENILVSINTNRIYYF